MSCSTETNDLRHLVARGDYVVNPIAVAAAMLGRDWGMPRADPMGPDHGRCSAVLVAGQLHRPAAAVEQTDAAASLDAS